MTIFGGYVLAAATYVVLVRIGIHLLDYPPKWTRDHPSLRPATFFTAAALQVIVLVTFAGRHVHYNLAKGVFVGALLAQGSLYFVARSRQRAILRATPGSSTAGWLPDPYRRFRLRYWSGQAWTEHVVDDGEPTTDPPD